MQRIKGRIALGGVLMLVMVVLVGAKMLGKGWFGLDAAKAKAMQQAPLVWPPQDAPASDPVCHTAKLSLAQRDKALDVGYAIDRDRLCITRASYAAYQAEENRVADAKAERALEARKRALAAQLQAELEQAVAQQVEQGGITLQNLAQARAGISTQVASALLPAASAPAQALPQPPAELFVPMRYRSGGLDLAGFATPNPQDGQRHPAIIWLTGGDTNTLGDFWVEGGAANDQSASAFRKAGMVMVLPSLRGGNTNPGQREYFWGEVDDVMAAVLFAAKLPYVDPARIYLGGHSTGATLALLAGATGLPLQGIFAFGPVADPVNYDARFIPVAWQKLNSQERRLRAPVQWLHAIKAPTWIIEGANPPGNGGALRELCAARKSDQVHCVSVPGHDHFSVLQPITRRIAAQIAMGQEPKLESAPVQ